MCLKIALLMLAGSTSVIASEIEEFIVTGSRTAEKIREVPASVSVVNRDDILEQLKSSPELQDMLTIHVPGFGANTGSTSNSGLTLRGRGVLVLIDGVPQSTPLRNGSLGVRSIDASAIERIEVVKGATSIYGSGASGGIVNYITKSPDNNTALSGDIGISSRFSLVESDDSFSKRIDGTVSGTVGKFSYLVNAVSDQRGEQKDAEGDTLGLVYGLSDLDTKNIFSKMAYAFDDDKFLQLSYNLYDSQQSTNLIDVNGIPNTGKKTFAIKNNTGVARPGDPQGPKDNSNMMLKYVDKDIFLNTQLTVDAYKQEIENVFFFSTSLANPDEGLSGGQSVIRSEKKGVRLNMRSDFSIDDLDVSMLYGIDMLNDLSSQPMVDGRIWVPEMDMDNEAIYLQSKWTWKDHWVLKLGVREEKTDIQVDDFSTLRLCRSATQCSVPFDVKGGDLDYRSTTYNIGLRYTANDLFNPFIAYSEGFDISDLGRLLRSAQVTDIADVRTEASIVEHYEVGFSSNFDDIKMEFSIYQSESSLGTGTRLDPATGIFLPVKEPQEIQGYELAIDYFYSENLSLGASYTHVSGENSDTGKPLSGRFISPDKLIAYLDWQVTDEFKVGATYQRIGSRKKFNPGSDGSYAIYEGPVDSYQLVNLRGTYSTGNWEVYGGIENLFNEDYFSARSQSIALASYYSKGLGRTGNLGITYHF